VEKEALQYAPIRAKNAKPDLGLLGYLERKKDKRVALTPGKFFWAQERTLIMAIVVLGGLFKKSKTSEHEIQSTKNYLAGSWPGIVTLVTTSHDFGATQWIPALTERELT